MNRTGCVGALLYCWHRLTSQGSLTDDGSMLRSVGVRAKASNDQRYAMTADWPESCSVCFIDPQ